MPEISVEGEPWLGLVVLRNITQLVGSPGNYGLARAAEWYSDSKYVTLWRGPLRKDEIVARENLTEEECRTVLVDDHGYYTCPPIIDELRDEAREQAEKLLDEWANDRAAETYSYIDAENLSEKYGGEIWIKAEFGDAVAVNGDLVFGRRGRKPPRNYELTAEGGHIPGGDEGEFGKDYLVERLTPILEERLKRMLTRETVKEVLDKLYPKAYIYWTSDSGHSEVWASRRAIRKAEEKEELEAMRRQAEESMRRAAEHNRRIEEERRQEAEQREKMKKGGYPTPKDWSPKGRFPWERR